MYARGAAALPLKRRARAGGPIFVHRGRAGAPAAKQTPPFLLVPAMDLSKLYRPSALNSFQFVAVTGLLMSAGAHFILAVFVGRVPAGFGWLYVCWLVFYAGGTLLNYFGKPNAGHRHDHHDHDHDGEDQGHNGTFH